MKLLDERMTIEAIKHVCSILERHEVIYWLDYGGLLGVVREGRILPWDNDMEIGCMASSVSLDKMRSITREINCSGYDSYYSSVFGYINVNKQGVDITICFYIKENSIAMRPHEPKQEFSSQVAVFFYQAARLLAMSRGGKVGRVHLRSVSAALKLTMVSAVGLLPKKVREFLFMKCIKYAKLTGGVFHRTAIPAHFYEQLKPVRFYDFAISAPRSTFEYLEFLYGKGWKTPKKNWKYYHQDKKTENSIRFINQSWEHGKYDIC